MSAETKRAAYERLVSVSRDDIRRMFSHANKEILWVKTELTDEDVNEFSIIVVAGLLNGANQIDAITTAAAALQLGKLR